MVSGREVAVMAARGLGLPEALVALALLGVALSGLLAAQWQARDLQADALQNQQALLMLSDFGQRMALNPAGHASYLAMLQAGLPATMLPDACARDACTPEARARADTGFLAGEARRLLPRPAWQLEACVDSPGHCLLLAWAGTVPSSGPDGGCLDASGLHRPGAHCLVRELP